MTEIQEQFVRENSDVTEGYLAAQRAQEQTVKDKRKHECRMLSLQAAERLTPSGANSLKDTALLRDADEIYEWLIKDL